MKIPDRIYGEITITNPLIEELILSKPFQRLKGISQDGAPHFIQPVRDVTRFEHCIGTWYLSQKFHRTIEEQIASLLHDIPHTAFSHVIDFVMHDKKHEYHDKFTKQIIINSEIPDILKMHDISLEKVLAKECFPLLNNDLPDISVDRWDYFMRDAFTIGLLPKETITLFLENIHEQDEKFYFSEKRIAGMFAILFMNSSRLIWLDPTSHGSFFLISEAIKIALEKHFITQEDFFMEDAQVLQKLQATNDEHIISLLNRLQPGREFNYAEKDQAEFYGPNKPRYVDPWVLADGQLVHASAVIPNLTEYFAQFVATHTNLGVRQVTSELD